MTARLSNSTRRWRHPTSSCQGLALASTSSSRRDGAGESIFVILREPFPCAAQFVDARAKPWHDEGAEAKPRHDEGAEAKLWHDE